MAVPHHDSAVPVAAQAPTSSRRPTLGFPAALFAAALLPAVLIGCTESEEATEEVPVVAATPSAEVLGAVRAPAGFRGTLPCADCPGIVTTLELAADGSATLTRLYLEAEAGRDAAMTEAARWADDDAGRLVVVPDDGPPLYFAFDRDGLLGLDREGLPYDSALPRLLERLPRGEAAELTGTAWAFVEPASSEGGAGSEGDAGSEVASESNPSPATLRFVTGGRLAGGDGCNELTGSWGVREGTLTITSAATSARSCAADAEQRARQVYAALGAATAYRIEETALILLDGNGAEVARLRPIA